MPRLLDIAELGSKNSSYFADNTPSEYFTVVKKLMNNKKFAEA